MTATPHAIVDLAALVRNFRAVCAVAAPAEAACVVKANAYGLGVGPVATALQAAGCRRFFVATVLEGVELRSLIGESGGTIYVLDGPAGTKPGELVRHSLVPVLNSASQVRRWSRAGPAALHVDTGMQRLGLDPVEAEALSADGHADGIVLLMTHLACADEPGHPLTQTQVAAFRQVAAAFPRVPTSIGNSAGTFSDQATRGDVVRAGIMLYGGNPFVDREGPGETVVSFRAPVLQVRRLERAAPVGYGATYVAAAGTTLATVAAGYADGYPRCLGNRGVVALRDTRIPVVGRVSMDLIVVDVSAVEGEPVEEGEEVELFGHAVSIDEVASAAGTISYELLTQLGRRVERQYVGEAARDDVGRSVRSERMS